ncbi:DUF2147 domain-containing protein [Rhodoferax saidenbachensis]|uniref:Uncharacterized protein (DUF2147 family) n=1 Tax=Rhodoferax saidenbachensis TaxID=1484693 RepID=A0ABU1ZKD2_9BURK|nr:DUF2147 domain-containing protein [Rhodoferax saidenbachensis]MDR7306012.1 uncharacterized protein (DUF2147 family) [Rhodoferax saidenbachensis]
MIRNTLVATLALSAFSVMAQMTPVGLWRTIDDKDGSAKSEIRIVENNGVVSGRIEKVMDPKAKSDELCVECKDDRKDQPMLGLELIRGLKKAEGKDVWEGGTIVEPSTGKVYKMTMTPIEGGKKIEMRGYIGFFYRTQTWVRVQ